MGRRSQTVAVVVAVAWGLAAPEAARAGDAPPGLLVPWRLAPPFGRSALPPAPLDEPWRLHALLARPRPRELDAPVVADPLAPPLGRLRLEATGRVLALLESTVRRGPESFAHDFVVAHDASLPQGQGVFGYRFLAEAKLNDRLAFGLTYERSVVSGPERLPHVHGLTLRTTYFPPDTPVRTRIDLRTSEVLLRYVGRDDDDLRFSFGAGAALVSYRIRLSSRDRSASGGVEVLFAPTIGYFLAARLGAAGSFFFEGTTAVIAPRRLLSYASHYRIGMRWGQPRGLEVITAVVLSSGQLRDYKEVWGGEPPQGHEWRVATWQLVGFEVGVALSF